MVAERRARLQLNRETCRGNRFTVRWADAGHVGVDHRVHSVNSFHSLQRE
jgi:hypothetical protein